jgi:hypothetical protein
MNNFKKIQSDIDVSPFLKELETYLQKYPWDTARSMLIDVQKETRNIHLRHHVTSQKFPEIPNSPLHALTTHTYPHFQNTYAFLERIARKQNGSLSRAMIVKLLPHSQVYKHYDAGTYYKVRDRYHLVLQSDGSRMTSGNEECIWHKGELWWFNNKLVHEAFNESDKERIHIIFDVLPQKPTLLRRLTDYLHKKRALLLYGNTTH